MQIKALLATVKYALQFTWAKVPCAKQVDRELTPLLLGEPTVLVIAQL